MGDDDLTPVGSRSHRRKWDSGVYVPVASLGALVLAFAVFLFNRIDSIRDDITTKMEAARAARNVQVSSIERDVVRLQDQQANTAAVLAEIKGDVHTIIDKLDEINRRKP